MGTLAALLPEVHLALSYAEGCRAGLADYLRERGNALPSRLTLVTGPSRTGDIEAHHDHRRAWSRQSPALYPG